MFPCLMNFDGFVSFNRPTQMGKIYPNIFTHILGDLFSKELLLTFQEVVGPKALAILHVFHHIVSKFVHVS